MAISALDWQSKTLNNSKTWLVDKFRSETDYWGALVGSSTLTCAGYDPAKPANGGPTYVTYRNTPSMDGAYANDLRVLCKALGQEYGKRKSTCVTIESFVPGGRPGGWWYTSARSGAARGWGVAVAVLAR